MPRDMSSSRPGIEARTEHETQIVGGSAARVAGGNPEQRGDTRPGLAGTNAVKPLLHQQAVVVVEADDVGDGAEGNEIEQAREVGLGALFEGATSSEFRSEGQHQIKHHADAGEVLARETATGLVRIDDALRVGQGGAGQVMISYPDAHAGRIGGDDTFDAGDTVIDRNQHIRIFLRLREGDDFRRQAVAVFETVRHQIIDLGAEGA